MPSIVPAEQELIRYVEHGLAVRIEAERHFDLSCGLALGPAQIGRDGLLDVLPLQERRRIGNIGCDVFPLIFGFQFCNNRLDDLADPARIRQTPGKNPDVIADFLTLCPIHFWGWCAMSSRSSYTHGMTSASVMSGI